MKSFRNYCISHEPPLLPEKFLDFTIGLGDYRPARGTHISQLDSFWDIHRPVAYGAAGTYVVPRAVANDEHRTELTGLCSYRKIVVRHPIGRAAFNYPNMRKVSAAELSGLDRDEIRPREEADFLVPMSLRFRRGMIEQYGRVHHVDDLSDYLSIAVQLGVISDSDRADFASERLFVPGGCELGVYPTAWLIDALSKLERIGREFLARHAERIRGYDEYQVRAVGFLSERLGSFLLLKELRGRYGQQVPRDVFGYMCTVVAGWRIYRPGTTSS